jgi:predicted nicotinamide N-methyase
MAQEPGREMQDRGTGGTVWNCAFVMAKYLEQLARQESIDAWRSLRVLELGSGTGIVGLAAAVLFRPELMQLTDLPAQLPLIEVNLQAARNVADGESRAGLDRVRIGTLDWAAPSETPGAYDVILASDCVWPKVDNSLFVHALRSLATPRTRVLLAYEYRGESCRQTFFAPAEKLFTFTRVPDQLLHPDYRTDDIEVYSLTRIAA